MNERAPRTVTRARSLALLERNLADTLRHIARHGGGTIDETPARLLVAGRHRYRGPLLNAALRTDRTADPNEVVADAERFFTAQRRDFVIWAAAHGDADLAAAAEATGLSYLSGVGGGTCMILNAPPDEPRLREGAELTMVADGRDVRDFSRVLGEAFESLGQPPAVAHTMFARPSALLGPSVCGFLVRLHGATVSCGLALSSLEVTGLYFIGTIPSARGLGLGEAVTRAAALAAFSRGADCVVLEATARAEPMYRRIGFEELSLYCTYGAEPPSEPTDGSRAA